MEEVRHRPVLNNNELLMISLSKFYKNKSNMQKMMPVITGKSSISLRLLDWFVTNYSKKKCTNITLEDGNNVVHFNVFLSYKSQLKAYSKHQFDPFRRLDRITFYYEKDKSIETTIGQLNFFKWVIQNNILDYLLTQIADIEKDMLEAQKIQEKNTNNRKRAELSKSFVKNMNRFDCTRVIDFA
jgi:hypothetical protein